MEVLEAVAVEPYREIPDTMDWAAVYLEYHDGIRAYVCNRVNDSELADDLTADVFTKAMRAYAEGKGARRHLRGWLYRIATNLITDHYRKRARVGPVLTLDDSAGDLFEIPITADLDSGIVLEMVERAIARLTPLQMAAVNASLAGYRNHEIGEMLGVTEGAGKSLLHRGRVTLRVILGELRREIMGAKKIEQELIERFKRATAYRLRYATVDGDGRVRVHLCAYGKALLQGRDAYNLCGAAWEAPSLQVGKSYTDKGVCKECLKRLEVLARRIAGEHKADLWAIAHGDYFKLTTEEVGAALAQPNIWGEFEAEAPQAALLPEEYLPKGSGQLFKRSWE